MNVILWAIQILLAVKFVSAAYTHGLRFKQEEMQKGIQRLGKKAKPLLIISAIIMLLGGIGLILPRLIGKWNWSVPCSAALLALMMFFAIGFHVFCRERPKVLISLILFVLAAFLALGRWVIAPL
jgi:hypothetical protein